MYVIITIHGGKLDSVQTYHNKKYYEWMLQECLNRGWGEYKEGRVDGISILYATDGKEHPCYSLLHGPWTRMAEQREAEKEWHIPVLTTTE